MGLFDFFKRNKKTDEIESYPVNCWVFIANKGYKDYHSLSASERVWYNMRVPIDSVNNGGLVSYYYNSGADNIYDTLEILKKFKADEIIEIVTTQPSFSLSHFPRQRLMP